jgi:hypothetical protein
MTIILVGAAIAYLLALRLTSRRAGIRWALGILIGGLLAYNLLSIGLFGLTAVAIRNSLPGVIAFVSAGGVLGLFGGVVWSRRS